MKAAPSNRWLPLAVGLQILSSSLIVAAPTRGDSALQASLEYSVLPNAYNDSVLIPLANPRLAVDRDPNSPSFGTVYALAFGGNSECADIDDRELWFARSADGGQTFGPVVHSPLCLRPYSGGPVDVAIGRGGALFVSSPSGVFRSVDGGESWKEVLEAYAHSVAIDNATGAIYVASTDPSGTLQVSSTQDGGDTWTGPANVSMAGPAGLGWEPVAEIAAHRGAVVVAFVRTQTTSEPPWYFERHLLAAASADEGLSWSNVTTLSSGLQFQTPSLDVSPSGVFGLSWTEFNDSNESTLVSVSTDGGRTFSDPVLPGDVVGGTGAFGHALAFDQGSRLYVTWHSKPNQSLPGTSLNPDYNSSIYVAVSANNGASFEDASFKVTLTGGSANGTPYQSLVASPEDAVLLNWGGYGGQPSRIRTVAGQATGGIVLSSQTAPGTPVDLVLRDQLTASALARATWTGSNLVVNALPPSVYDVWVEVGNASALAGAMPVRTWNQTAFTVHVQAGAVGPGPSPFPWLTAAAVGGVVFVASAALLALQHTRLAREDILQRKVRLLIYETIREHPGYSFAETRDAVGLQNGVAAYHLGVLEKRGLVHSEKGRRHRWYYANGDVSLWRDLPLSPMQRALLLKVRDAPGMGIRELARSLNRRHGSVAYNVKGLAREGLLRTQRTGRKVRCFPTDGWGTA